MSTCRRTRPAISACFVSTIISACIIAAMLLGLCIGEASNPGPNQFDDPEFDSGMFESLDDLAEPFFEPPPPEQDDVPPDGGPDAEFGEDVVIETRPFVKAEPQRGRLGKFSGSKPGMCFRLGEHGLGYYRDGPPCHVQPDRCTAWRPTAVHVLELDVLVPVPTPSVPAPPVVHWTLILRVRKGPCFRPLK